MNTYKELLDQADRMTESDIFDIFAQTTAMKFYTQLAAIRWADNNTPNTELWCAEHNIVSSSSALSYHRQAGKVMAVLSDYFEGDVPLPTNEYQCRSLHQGCDTDLEIVETWVNVLAQDQRITASLISDVLDDKVLNSASENPDQFANDVLDLMSPPEDDLSQALLIRVEGAGFYSYLFEYDPTKGGVAIPHVENDMHIVERSIMVRGLSSSHCVKVIVKMARAFPNMVFILDLTPVEGDISDIEFPNNAWSLYRCDNQTEYELGEGEAKDLKCSMRLILMNVSNFYHVEDTPFDWAIIRGIRDMNAFTDVYRQFNGQGASVYVTQPITINEYPDTTHVAVLG